MPTRRTSRTPTPPPTKMGRPTLFGEKTARLGSLRITEEAKAKIVETATVLDASETDALEALVRAAPTPAVVAARLRRQAARAAPPVPGRTAGRPRAKALS